MPDQNHEKQKHANNVVQFHLRKMKYQVEHPIRSKLKPYFTIVLFLTTIIIFYKIIFPPKALQTIPVSKHEFNGLSNNVLEIKIHQNVSGLYVLPATLNNEHVNLIIDSGANGVSISERVADSAKLKKGKLIVATTAAGPIIEYLTVVKSLKINRIHFTNLTASINPSMTLNGVLLGTNVLEKFEITIKNKIMTLRCRTGVSC